MTTVGRLLDVLEVRPQEPWNDAHWDTLRAEIAALLALLANGQAEEARGRVVDAVSEALRPESANEARLWPVTVDTSTAEGHTLLRISGQDTIGFLFELTNALALLDVTILGGEIRTVNSETRDVLAIAGAHGEALADEARLRQVRAAVALIKQFTALLPFAPDPAQALRQFGALTRQLLAQPDWAQRLAALAGGEAQRTLAEVMGASTFLWEDFLRMQHESLFPLVGDVAALDRRVTEAELRSDLDAAIAHAPAEARRGTLNGFKDHEMFRIDLRHITGRIGFREFALALSELASVVVDAAAHLAEATVEADAVRPHLVSGEVPVGDPRAGQVRRTGAGIRLRHRVAVCVRGRRPDGRRAARAERAPFRGMGARVHGDAGDAHGGHLRRRPAAATVRQRRAARLEPRGTARILRAGGPGPAVRAAGAGEAARGRRRCGAGRTGRGGA